MAKNAGESFVQEFLNAKVIDIPITITDHTTPASIVVAVDTTRLDPALVGKVGIIGSAIAGTLCPEQTFTGADVTANPATFGIELLDGLAQRVSGHGQVQLNTGAGNAGTAVPLPLITVAGVAAQVRAGVTSSGNVGVICTLASGGANRLDQATGTGKGIVRLFVS